MDQSSQEAAERRLNQVFGQDWTRADVIEFQRREKFLLLALDESRYRQLGTLVGNNANHERGHFATEYSRLFRETLERDTSPGSHFNSLQHMYGFLREKLSSSNQDQFQETIEAFYRQQLPLSDVLRLFRETLKDHPDSYLADQTYLTEFGDTAPEPGQSPQA